MKRIFDFFLSLGAVLSLVPAACAAQGYTVSWSDTSTYSVSCGSLVGNQWMVKNDTCVFLSATITAGGVPGDPDQRAEVSIVVNPMGALSNQDFIRANIYTESVLNGTVAVRGDTVHAKFAIQLVVYVPAGSTSRIEVMANSVKPQYFWLVEDHGISMSFPATPLPVELADFRRSRDDDRVTLQWITRSETNNDYFTVERSDDGHRFDAVATVEGKGSVTTLSVYAWEERIDPGRLAYYRLRQTDFDGTSKYLGKTITIQPARTRSAVTVFPNPARGNDIHVLVRDCRHQDIDVEVRNGSGTVLFSKSGIAAQDVADVVIRRDELHLSRGLYLVTVRQAGSRQSERLVVND